MAESDQYSKQALPPASASPDVPVKGILKKGKTEPKKPKFVHDGDHPSNIQWDEMNILMTEHPANKDYGHMKIDEPKTPYHENMPDEEEVRAQKLFTDVLSEKVMEAAKEGSESKWDQESSGSEFGEEESLTDEQKEHKRKFREWRKKHYNEFLAVKRARELIQQEDEELKRLEQEEQQQQQQQQQQQEQEEEDQTMEVDSEAGGRTNA